MNTMIMRREKKVWKFAAAQGGVEVRDLMVI